MKAISVWQPWASAIACGSKKIETRHWSTNYRGPLAIHAAKRLDKDDLEYFASCSNWQGALQSYGLKLGSKPLCEILPFGAVIASCTLIGCSRIETLMKADIYVERFPADGNKRLAWKEIELGNYQYGRFAWILSDIKMLKRPYPFKGQQGLFEVPDFIFKKQ